MKKTRRKEASQETENEDDSGESNDDETSKGRRSEDIDVDNSRSNDTDDDDDSESSPTSTDDFVDAPMPNELPNGFNHNLQEPIYMEDPFSCMSNIFAYSKRFGCIICLQQECQQVIADTKCYNHLKTNHHHLVATVENGARKKLLDVVSEIKVESPPLFTNPTAIWQHCYLATATQIRLLFGNSHTIKNRYGWFQMCTMFIIRLLLCCTE
jgi:hypothetical protein